MNRRSFIKCTLTSEIADLVPEAQRVRYSRRQRMRISMNSLSCLLGKPARAVVAVLAFSGAAFASCAELQAFSQ